MTLATLESARRVLRCLTNDLDVPGGVICVERDVAEAGQDVVAQVAAVGGPRRRRRPRWPGSQIADPLGQGDASRGGVEVGVEGLVDLDLLAADLRRALRLGCEESVTDGAVGHAASGPGSGCRVVLSRPWVAPITNVVIGTRCIHASTGRDWQVAIPTGGRRFSPAAPAHRGTGARGHDGGQIGGGEAQMFAEEGARDLAGGGLLPQPRLADLQPPGGLGRGVQQRVGTGAGRLFDDGRGGQRPVRAGGTVWTRWRRHGDLQIVWERERGQAETPGIRCWQRKPGGDAGNDVQPASVTEAALLLIGSSGLLIRGFGVRVPGGAQLIKALTW